jgi:hypothetical protein
MSRKSVYGQKYNPIWRKENRVHIREYERIWAKNNAGRVRQYDLKRRYGLNIEQYDSMLVNQAGKCAICLKPFIRSPQIDHDHKTGKVRGLLCIHCNRTIVNVIENHSNLLARAKGYLKRARCAPKEVTINGKA